MIRRGYFISPRQFFWWYYFGGSILPGGPITKTKNSYYRACNQKVKVHPTN